MDAYECITTKRDVRQFSSKDVSVDLQTRVLEAGRLSGSGKNSQHWRFVLVRDKQNLNGLAEASTTGMWVQGANFAVIVLTDPQLGFHKIDAGRAAEDMQLAAWSHGLVSCIYTGINEQMLRELINVPEDLSPTIVVGFGYPAEKVTGKKKNRKPLEQVAFLEKYGNPLK